MKKKIARRVVQASMMVSWWFCKKAGLHGFTAIVCENYKCATLISEDFSTTFKAMTEQEKGRDGLISLTDIITVH